MKHKSLGIMSKSVCSSYMSYKNQEILACLVSTEIKYASFVSGLSVFCSDSVFH